MERNTSRLQLAFTGLSAMRLLYVAFALFTVLQMFLLSHFLAIEEDRHRRANFDKREVNVSLQHKEDDTLTCRRRSKTPDDLFRSTSSTKVLFPKGANLTAFHEYSSRKELMDRTKRFPSVQDRVKLYMSNWYVPPCENNTEGYVLYRNATRDGSQFFVREIEGYNNKDRVFLINNTDAAKSILHIDKKYHLEEKEKGSYQRDFEHLLLPAFRRLELEHKRKVPILVETGDYSTSVAYVPSDMQMGKNPNIPFVRKFRLAMDSKEISCLTSSKCYMGRRELPVKYDEFQPIIWLARMHRYYSELVEVSAKDIPWSRKKDMALFRGRRTGKYKRLDKMLRNDLRNDHSDALIDCLYVYPRCRLAHSHLNSTLVDAKIIFDEEKNVNKLYADLLKEGYNLEGTMLNITEMLQYKALIVLEGNDVASALKWALLSQSVVMTQTPTCTSWAMEELLEPWVHYIPLNENLTDVEEKMQWIIDNDEEAQRIAHRGSLWIKDLILHPDALGESKLIFREMARRYSNHFAASKDLGRKYNQYS